MFELWRSTGARIEKEKNAQGPFSRGRERTPLPAHDSGAIPPPCHALFLRPCRITRKQNPRADETRHEGAAMRLAMRTKTWRRKQLRFVESSTVSHAHSFTFDGDRASSTESAEEREGEEKKGRERKVCLFHKKMGKREKLFEIAVTLAKKSTIEKEEAAAEGKGGGGPGVVSEKKPGPTGLNSYPLPRKGERFPVSLRKRALVLCKRCGALPLPSKVVDRKKFGRAKKRPHHRSNKTVCLALGINLRTHFVVIATRGDDFGAVSGEEPFFFFSSEKRNSRIKGSSKERKANA